MLTPTRKIEVITGKPRAPIFQHREQFTGRYRRRQRILRLKTEPGTGYCRLGHQIRFIADKLAAYPHIQLAALFGKLPHIQAARSGKTQINAVMPGQVLGDGRLCMAGKVIRRTRHQHTQIRLIRTATMSLATCSPNRTPASKP